MYIPTSIAKEFVKEFYRNFIQGYIKATGLIARLQEKYIIHGIWKIAREIISKYLDC